MLCNLCQADDAEFLLEGHDRFHDIPGTYRLVRCSRCGLIYLDPMPTLEALARHYPPEYFPYSVAIDDETSFFKRWDRRYGVYKRCRAVIQATGQPTGRVLDVGCATGNFLAAMRDRGWEAFGVEPNSYAANYARERLGLNVFIGELEEAGYATNFFDLVTLWDVLEHVPDPRATLEEVARILRPGGTLVLSLPNPETWEVKLFGRYWVGWDIPRHLYLFTRSVLTRYLNEAGFEVTASTSFTGRYHLFLLSLDLWARERCPQVRGPLLRVLRSWPARLLGLAFYSISDRVCMSTIMTVFARRLDSSDGDESHA